MPALGVAQQTGTLLKWLKNDGQSVAKGEPLMEIETDKATVEIEAPASGVLLRILVAEGGTVPIATTIALIGEPGEPLPVIPRPQAVPAPASTSPIQSSQSDRDRRTPSMPATSPCTTTPYTRPARCLG